MLAFIALNNCLGLIDLVLAGEEYGPNFTVNGVHCSLMRVGDHACFEAVGPNFGIAVVYPGWHAGEHGELTRVIIICDHIACLQWLSIERDDKIAIIQDLPLSASDKTLCRLAI